MVKQKIDGNMSRHVVIYFLSYHYAFRSHGRDRDHGRGHARHENEQGEMHLIEFIVCEVVTACKNVSTDFVSEDISRVLIYLRAHY